MELSNTEYSCLNAQATNYRTILRFMKAAGIDDFLSKRNSVPLDLLITPDDTTGGESICLFLKAISDECNTMDKKIQGLSEALVDASIQLAREKRTPRKSFFQKIKEFVVQ